MAEESELSLAIRLHDRDFRKPVRASPGGLQHGRRQGQPVHLRTPARAPMASSRHRRPASPPLAAIDSRTRAVLGAAPIASVASSLSLDSVTGSALELVMTRLHKLSSWW